VANCNGFSIKRLRTLKPVENKRNISFLHSYMPDVLSKAYPMAPFLANYKLVTQSLYGGDLDMKQIGIHKTTPPTGG
jgi:hypothetical protein